MLDYMTSQAPVSAALCDRPAATITAFVLARGRFSGTKTSLFFAPHACP